MLRPLGAQQNARQVVEACCQQLRAGGHMEELFRAVCPRRQRQRERREAAEEADDEASSDDEDADGHGQARRFARLEARRRRRAVALMHAGEPGAARRVLESSSHLGVLRRADVLQAGAHGEVVQAVPGSVAEEMLSKHPDAAPADVQLPDLDTLLAGAHWAAGRQGTRLKPGREPL